MKVYKFTGKTIFTWGLIFFLFLCACTPYCTRDEFLVSGIIKICTESYNESTAPKLRIKRLSIEEAAAKFNFNENDLREVGNHFVCISLNASGFCFGEYCTLYSTNLRMEKTVVGDFMATEAGELISFDTGKPLKNFNFTLSGFMNGEPNFYILISGSNCVFGLIVPNSIEFKWKDGASISAMMMTQEATTFLLSGNSFHPNESFIVTTSCDDEVIILNAIAKPDGTYNFPLPEFGITTTGGQKKVTIKRETSEEVGILNFWWGDMAIKSHISEII